MKVVHISISDKNGGAAIAAHRLHLSMLKEGLDSKMLVLVKETDEPEVSLAKTNKLEKHLYLKLRRKMEDNIFYKYRKRENPILFSSGRYGIDICNHPFVKEADIVHLHWINGAYLSLKSIKKLGELNKKIRWTLHDMWAFTGGCHYSNWCKKYEGSCGNCPILETGKEKDITRKIWEEKKKVFESLDIEIITCSNWLAECAKKSSLLKDKKIIVKANVLDKDVFKSLNKKLCREVLNLNKDKKYICFGAMNSTSDPRKGWKYLKESLYQLDKTEPLLKENIELLVFGASYGGEIEHLPFKTKFLGRVYDESTLALIYNSADVFVAPSLEDNLPNTVNESIHCKTSVVSFDVGGIPDMVNHKKNGYLAKYKDIEDLSRGILWCLENKVEEVKDDG